jgi:hypothetical protein
VESSNYVFRVSVMVCSGFNFFFVFCTLFRIRKHVDRVLVLLCEKNCRLSVCGISGGIRKGSLVGS